MPACSQQIGGRGAGREPAAAAKGAATVDPTIRALIEARVATAREVFEREMSRLENVTPISYEDTATWSRRWMDEELRLNPGPAETLGVIRDHLERVKRVEENASGYARAGQGRVADVLKAKYFRLEAEQRLAEARALYPGVALPPHKAVRRERAPDPRLRLRLRLRLRRGEPVRRLLPGLRAASQPHWCGGWAAAARLSESEWMASCTEMSLRGQ